MRVGSACRRQRRTAAAPLGRNLRAPPAAERASLSSELRRELLLSCSHIPAAVSPQHALLSSRPHYDAAAPTMDHWGDPWADTGHKSPTKQEAEVTSPSPPTITPAPVILNGFLDDAQWGAHEDNSFGAWASSPRTPEPETRVADDQSATSWHHAPEPPQHGLDRGDRAGMLPESNEWTRAEEDVEEFKESDNVVSETSDSATTIQPDDVPEQIATEFSSSLHPDDDLSTRPSTSPSDVSHNEAPTESPRTSFEDERAAKAAAVDEGCFAQTESEAEERPVEEGAKPASSGSREGDDDFGEFEDDVAQDATLSGLQAGSVQQPLPSPGWGAVQHSSAKAVEDEPTTQPALRSGVEHAVDSDILAQLFPPLKDQQQLEDAPDDPVHSTSSTRKAWYRLTRKQTMREFNTGNDDDNYIRVTWKTSYIRSEAVKIVARWANEDRIAGRGPGAKASFYWDTQAPPDQKVPLHPRKKASISVSNPIRPVRQTVQPLSSDVPAAFDWSSPSAATESKPHSGAVRSASSPITAKHSAITKLQRHGGRAVSVDLTSHPKPLAAHRRTSTATDLLNGTASVSSISPIEPPKSAVSKNADPWASLGALDISPSKVQETTMGDDDDDWGEMVESPAVSTVQTPIAELSEPATRDNTLSTPATTPRSVKSSPLQPLDVPAVSKHASPIVRLKGTVSPTSALFKPSAFVPTSVEQGPIGPGILKARNRSAGSTPEKGPPQPVALAQLDEVLQPTRPEQAQEDVDSPIVKNSQGGSLTSAPDDDFSALETSIPQPAPQPSPPPAQFTVDEPDFSIFESSLPVSAPAPTPAPQQADPSDPWSIFETPAPPPAEPPPPFSRPPPRAVTPPPKQPLTGATNSAQRRKAEEDDVVRGIVRGLPDLGYMLRR